MDTAPKVGPVPAPRSTHSRARKSIIAVLAGIIILAFGYIILITDRSEVVNSSGHVRLLSSTVAPGAVLTVEEQYQHHWPVEVMVDKIRITNAQGEQVNKTTTQLMNDLGVTAPPYGSLVDKATYDTFTAGVQKNAPKTTGFVNNRTQQQILDLIRQGPGTSQFATMGCAVGVGNPTGSAPANATEKQELYVFPSTPPSTYTLSMADAYCDVGGPEEVLYFTVQ